jgi:pimeloyl-ACP methyl ester carboxylesterase
MDKRGACLRSQTMAVSERNTWAQELRSAFELYDPRQETPEPTPPGGPDPYGPDPYGPSSSQWRSIDWHKHLHSADVVGAQTNYVEIGEGPPVLLVHGLSGSWQNWLENIPHLAERHRVVALDLPGFGDSPMPPWEISIPAYGRFLRDFCEEIGIGATGVIGSSLGGFVSTELAIADPARVERLVLVSAAGISWARARREPAAVFGRVARAAMPLAFRYQMEGLRRSRLRQLAYRGMVHDPCALDPRLLFEITVPALRAQAFYDAVTTLVGYDHRESLASIDVPTLIVWGRNDRVVPSPAALTYKRLIGHGNARMEIFDRCGHLPMLERPVRFNRLIDEFLASPINTTHGSSASRPGPGG